MPTRYIRDHDAVIHGMCDVRYDESLDEDFEPDSESDVSEDDDAHENSDGNSYEDAVYLREKPDIDLSLPCEHQRIVTFRTGYPGTGFESHTISVPLEDLYHYKAKRAPIGFIHRSRLDDLCRCCDKLNIPEETMTVAHYVYDCAWKDRIYGGSGERFSKAVISASLFIACNKHNFLITPEEICDEFNAVGKLFTRALTQIRLLLKSSMMKYHEWITHHRPRMLARWRMDDKRRNPEFSELLDRPEAVRKFDSTLPREIISHVCSAASFRRDMLDFRDASYPNNLWYIPL